MSTSDLVQVNRRQFLKLTGASGALVLGTSLPFSHFLFADENPDSHELNLFVSIDSDGAVHIVCHRSEMGQGIRTSITQVVAEELCASWDHVNVVQGLANPAYGSQNTDGSRSIRRFYTAMRQMGASARTMLESAAAELWKVPQDSVYAEDHFVYHKPTGRKLGFGYLAESAASQPVPDVDTLTFKDKAEFKFIGKPVKNLDFPSMVTGSAKYGQDIRLPDMLIASIERSPVVGGTVEAFDKDAAMQIKGVVDVIEMPALAMPAVFKPLSGVAVLATNTWAAQQGRQALNVTWAHGDNASHQSDTYLAELREKVQQKGKQIRQAGDAYAAMDSAAQRVSATYTMPYLIHAQMEPPAATAVVEGEHCEVWACTQTPQSTQQNVAGFLGLKPENVKVNVTLLGGGFGRKSKPDFSIEAAFLAKQSGKPVKVVWSREDDTKHGYYHAVSAQHFEAGLSAEGDVSGWVQRTAFPSISWTFTGTTDEPSDGELSLGFGDVPYAIDDISCETQKATGHLRIGWVRSVSNIHHAFARGVFVDEMAVAAGQPTHEFLHKLLGEDRHVDPSKQGFAFGNYGESLEDFPIDTARHKRVLDEVVKRSGADKPVAENEGWGICVHRSFVTYVAVATKVSVTDGVLKVLEMHSAIDAGTLVNIDRVKSQQEGSMIFGLSLAMMGEITVKDGQVVQSNYHDYPVLRMSQSPAIFTYIIESDAIPGGVGEPGTPPVAASLVNAIYHATGQRLRELPLNKHLQV